MSNNVTFQTTTLATAPNATVVETEDQGTGVQRQVVKVASTAGLTDTQLRATAVPVSGTVTATGTVTANAGTNLNTSLLALEGGGNLATVAGAIISQEATTSGVKGITGFGAVTTNAPSYTTAKSDALSLDTSGLLRISIKDTPANTNKFLVTPDSVALPANQSVNVSQVNGVTPLMGTGNTGTGSIRVTIATDQAQLTNKLLVTPDANSAVNIAQMNGVATTMGNGVAGTGVQRVAIASDNTAFSVNATLVAGSAVVGQVFGAMTTVTTSITRPNDTTAYAANDALSDSTSSPTAGGFTFTSCARISGGSGIITDAVIEMSTAAATPLQGELWLFDSSVTAINDNAAFTITDGEGQTLVGVIPFTANKVGGANQFALVQGLNIGFTTVGSANLRFLVKVINAYTPAAQEVLTARLKIVQVN